MYDYFICDGTLQRRDLRCILPSKFSGIVFDLCRTIQGEIWYDVLASCKNGNKTTGKYEGKPRNFHSVPVEVFANFMPNVTMLSFDCWEIIKLGHCNYSDANNTGLHSVDTIMPYVEPPVLPEPDNKIDISKFLSKKLNEKQSGLMERKTFCKSSLVVEFYI